MKTRSILASAAALLAATTLLAQDGDDDGSLDSSALDTDEAIFALEPDPEDAAEIPAIDADPIDLSGDSAVIENAPEPTLDQVVPVADETAVDAFDDAAADELEANPTVAASNENNVFATADDVLAPDASDEDKLEYEFVRYKKLMDLRIWDEADTAAKRVVELALELRGARSNDFAKALTNLAIVQHQNEQYDAAQQNYETAIEIIEENEDRLNAQLVNPLKGLGASQMESGRPDLAKDTFSRAVHVTHVNEGPHNLNQLFILESLSEADLRLGEIESAEVIQDRIYAINRRMFPEDSFELVNPLLKRADWQHRAGFIYEERISLRYAIRIIEEHKGKSSLDLVEPLLQLGRSYFYADTSGSQALQKGGFATGEIYFKRAQRIAQETEVPDWRVSAQTSLALGDHYMFQGNDQRARRVYKDLWDDLSQAGSQEHLDYRRAVLENFITLSQRQLPQFVQPDPDAPAESDEPALEGEVAIAYTISTRGRATKLKIVDADPEEFGDMVRFVTRELRARVYRPKFVDAEPVASDEQLLEHTFYYRQSDLDRIRAERAARN